MNQLETMFFIGFLVSAVFGYSFASLPNLPRFGGGQGTFNRAQRLGGIY